MRQWTKRLKIDVFARPVPSNPRFLQKEFAVGFIPQS